MDGFAAASRPLARGSPARPKAWNVKMPRVGNPGAAAPDGFVLRDRQTQRLAGLERDTVARSRPVAPSRDTCGREIARRLRIHPTNTTWRRRQSDGAQPRLRGRPLVGQKRRAPRLATRLGPPPRDDSRRCCRDGGRPSGWPNDTKLVAGRQHGDLRYLWPEKLRT